MLPPNEIFLTIQILSKYGTDVNKVNCLLFRQISIHEIHTNEGCKN